MPVFWIELNGRVRAQTQWKNAQEGKVFKKNLLVYFMSSSLHPNLGRLYISQLYPVQKILNYFTGISNAILILDRTLSYANSQTPLIPDSL